MLKTLNKPIPTLADSAFLRYFNFIALYFTEGLPQGMLYIGIPAWMANSGKSAGEIGAFAVAASLPWTFKFVVAPLMDRYTYLDMGRKRPWVLLGQIGLILSLIFMASVPDPLNNFDLFLVAGFCVSALGAIQDAAGDAMAVDVIPEHQQARANGYMQGSRMLGSSLSLAVGSLILEHYGFSYAILTIAAAIVVITLIPLLLLEQPGEKILPFMKGQASPISRQLQMTQWSTILKALYKVFKLKNSIIVVAILFITMGAYNFFEHLLPIFTIDNTGWTNVDYSQAFATADIVGGIGGIFLGGWLIEKFGKRRMIAVYFFTIIGLALLLSFVKAVWADSDFMYGYIVTYRLFNAFAKIGVFAVAMQCCSQNVSASQYTIYMTMGATGSIAGASLIGPIKDNYGWELSFGVFIGLMAIALLLLYFLNIQQQVEQIAAMEEEQVERFSYRSK
ncbi:MAG: MFS transporter [Bacteroidota bacterium]